MIESLQFILPESILTFFSFVVLLASVSARFKNLAPILTLFAIFLSVFFLPASFSAGHVFFSGMLVNDGLSMGFRVILLFIAGMITMISMGYKDLPQEDKAEYYFFLLVLTISMMLAVSSNNLVMIYITLETISIISYIMAGYFKRDIFSSEAGVKYFLFGSLSTGITLYGISLLYGLFGTLDLTLIRGILSGGAVNQMALFAVLIFILAGLAFKCSLVPFHMWTPDVYEGAPTPVAAIFSVAPKAVGFAFFIRIFIDNFQPFFPHWRDLAAIIAILTMTLGNIAALKQENIKRLLAYSTIAQAGYIFVGFAIGTGDGIKSSLVYIFIYTFMNLGAFGAVIAARWANIGGEIEEYAGLYKRDSITAIVLTVSLLSLAGIPPLAGFMAKFFILASAVGAKQIILAIAVVINSVISLYYYTKVIKVMFFYEPKETRTLPGLMPIHLVLLFTLMANIFIGGWPHPFINWLTNLFHLT